MVSIEHMCLPDGKSITGIIPSLLKAKCGKGFKYGKFLWKVEKTSVTEHSNGYIEKEYWLNNPCTHKNHGYAIEISISKYGDSPNWDVVWCRVSADFGDIPF